MQSHCDARWSRTMCGTSQECQGCLSRTGHETRRSAAEPAVAALNGKAFDRLIMALQSGGSIVSSHGRCVLPLLCSRPPTVQDLFHHGRWFHSSTSRSSYCAAQSMPGTFLLVVISTILKARRDSCLSNVYSCPACAFRQIVVGLVQVVSVMRT